MSPLAHHEYANILRKARRPQAVIEEQQKLAAAGRELRTRMLRLSSAVDISAELLDLLGKYAEQCEDQQVAEAVRLRLEPSHTVPLAVP
jgi:hypothetical protein